MFTEIDRIATMDFAIDKAAAEGEEKGVARIASTMKTKGYPIETICEITGLSQEKVASL